MAKPWSIWNIAVIIFAVIGVLGVVAMIGMWVMHGSMMGRMGGSPSGQPLVSCRNAEV